MFLRHLTPALLLTLLASCSPYTNHLPVSSPGKPASITLKVGERRDIATRTGGSGINPVPTLGPAHYLSSSDTRVLAIEGKSFEATARAVAIAPGTADPLHRRKIRPRRKNHPRDRDSLRRP